MDAGEFGDRNFIAITNFWPGHEVVYPGETLHLNANVKNISAKAGTIYARFLVANSYQLEPPLFDSDKNLPDSNRHALRIVDIAPDEIRSAVCSYQLPIGMPRGHFDIRLEVWNPHLLFSGPYKAKYADSGWVGGFEVIARPVVEPKVFISYAQSPEPHKNWVRQFDDELRKYNINAITDWRNSGPGENLAVFMERGISESQVVLLICSESFTAKANNRQAGVGFEANIAAEIYLRSSLEERARFIAIVRDNELPDGKKLPTYLGSSRYIDMSGPNWRATPMSQLVEAIRRLV